MEKQNDIQFASVLVKRGWTVQGPKGPGKVVEIRNDGRSNTIHLVLSHKDGNYEWSVLRWQLVGILDQSEAE